ncbi:MAG: hypothetical protein JXB07_20485 [Anaerolineae bacterium]|nr:hypothetical protein [Anaerolineae bacterium]
MDSENPITPPSSPITLKEVLQAVFMPPQDDPPPALPAISAQQLWSALPVAGTSMHDFDLADLDQPTITHYEDSPIEPVSQGSPQRIAVLGVGVVLTILIAHLAQMSLSGHLGSAAGAFFYGLAIVIWLGLLAFEFAPPDGGLLRRGPRIVGGGAARPLLDNLVGSNLIVRASLASLALTLSAATYVFTAHNTFTAQGMLMWILSVVVWMLVAAERSPDQLVADWRTRLAGVRIQRPVIEPRHWLAAGAFIAILGVAVFFRVYRLSEIPGEMTSDHVEKLLDAYDVSQGFYYVFFPNNGGREALQFYLVALADRLFGTGMSFLTLKLVSVLESLLLIPLIIWLGRELIDWETGFFAAALLAISWWDTLLARLALRIILTPLLFTLVLMTLTRGVRSGSRKAWLWAGVWMGIGVYGYQAMRIAPLVSLFAFLIAAGGPLIGATIAHVKKSPDADIRRLVAANIAGRQMLNLALSALIALAIFVPMLRFWHDAPFEMWNRVINRTTDNEVAIQGTPAQVFADNYIKALGMYNVSGDHSWFNAVPREPALDMISGALLVLGLSAWSIRLLIRRDPVDLFFLMAGLVMLLPSALAIAFPIENPSLTRGSGTMPIVFVLAAWPLALIRQRWCAVMGQRIGMGLATGLVAILIGVAAAVNYQVYFVQFESSYRNSALNPGQVARAVRQVIGPNGSMEGTWLQSWPYWHDYRAIGIEAGDITFSNAILDLPMLQHYLDSKPESFLARPLVFIVHLQDAESLDLLKERFPTGRAEFHPAETEKHGFYLFVVPLER